VRDTGSELIMGQMAVCIWVGNGWCGIVHVFIRSMMHGLEWTGVGYQ
jgi:hypothetical protein